MTSVLLPTVSARYPVLHSSAAVLILGQGYTDAAEFSWHAGALVQGIAEVPPFDQLIMGQALEGRLVVLADPCLGMDFGITAADPTAPRALGLPDNGAALQQGLSSVAVPNVFLGMSTTRATSAAEFFDTSVNVGGHAKLIVILRKPPAGATPGELYRLPLVVVDVNSKRNWTQIVTRGLSQLLAGLGDEFSRTGPEWDAPPADWITDPNLPKAPVDCHRLGHNLIIVTPAMKPLLGRARIRTLADLDRAWVERNASDDPTPYRAVPGGPVIGGNRWATIAVVQGGGGFRNGVLHCDKPCLLAQVPAEPNTPFPPAVGDSIGLTTIGLCPVCEKLVAHHFGRGWATADAQPRSINAQLSHFDLAGFGAAPTTVPPAGVATRLVSATISRDAIWKFNVGVDGTGLVISSLKLASRPGDPMSASDDVAESITFTDLAYDLGDGPQDLSMADALANSAHPPRLEIGRNVAGLLRLGVRLTVYFQTAGGQLVKAEMSLVCRDIKNDFDPGGAAEACKFYPELVLSWSRLDPAAAAVASLSGCVRIVANNRMTSQVDHHHDDHHDMVPNSQQVMLLADSNARDFNYSTRFGLVVIPAFPPVPSLTIPLVTRLDWVSGRLASAVDLTPGAVGYLAWEAGGPLLPEWSWLFDYGRAVGTGSTETVEVVAWEETEKAHGAAIRKPSQPWPPNPDPALPMAKGPPVLTALKLPRQGGFDNIHLNADMGTDALKRPVIAAPFCADLCLHLHVRWGVHAAASALEDKRPFLGWSSGPHAHSHSATGAPLVPPNQRVSFGVTRPAADKTVIRYLVTVSAPRENKRQVILEQGLGFAFSYGGLINPVRYGLGAAYGLFQLDLLRDYLAGDDAATRAFFRGIYTRIRFLSYGYAGTDAPQQIPTDVFAMPGSAERQAFRKLVDT